MDYKTATLNEIKKMKEEGKLYHNVDAKSSVSKTFNRDFWSKAKLKKYN